MISLLIAGTAGILILCSTIARVGTIEDPSLFARVTGGLGVGMVVLWAGYALMSIAILIKEKQSQAKQMDKNIE